MADGGNMTKKLYEKDPYLIEFEAKVISNKAGYIVLDQTAFFAKGGGQEAEGGFINDFEVKDVYIKDDIIYHECDCDLKEGQHVKGKINFEKRYDNMQQHTGEHILSGVVENRFGYTNVGFHIGENTMRVDYSGYLTDEQLMDIEKEANDVIIKNIDIYQGYPEIGDDRLKGFRFKKELEGNIRIVDISGVDCCACCGTHMKRTGEVGIIKIVNSSKYKNGVRLNVLCGYRALTYYNFLLKQSDNISQMISTNVLDLQSGVKKLVDQKLELEKEKRNLDDELINYKCIELSKTEKAHIVSFENIDAKALKKMASNLRKMTDKDIFIFSESNGRINYIFSSNSRDMKVFNEEFKAIFDSKGGGNASSVSGSLVGNREEILNWINKKVFGVN